MVGRRYAVDDCGDEGGRRRACSAARGAESVRSGVRCDATRREVIAQRQQCPLSGQIRRDAVASRRAQHGVVSRRQLLEPRPQRRGDRAARRRRAAAPGPSRRLRRRPPRARRRRALDGRGPRLRPRTRRSATARRRAAGACSAAHRRRHDVVVPGAGGRRRDRDPRPPPSRPAPDETTTRERIPVTTPARTILDLAATPPTAALKHAPRPGGDPGAHRLPRPRRPGPSPPPPPRSRAAPDSS